mgnify:FL=1
MLPASGNEQTEENLNVFLRSRMKSKLSQIENDFLRGRSTLEKSLISIFNTDFYYQSRDYIKECFLTNKQIA